MRENDFFIFKRDTFSCRSVSFPTNLLLIGEPGPGDGGLGQLRAIQPDGQRDVQPAVCGGVQRGRVLLSD
jgi:hypothetical protein